MRKNIYDAANREGYGDTFPDEAFGIIDTMDTHKSKGWPGQKDEKAVTHKDTKKSSGSKPHVKKAEGGLKHGNMKEEMVETIEIFSEKLDNVSCTCGLDNKK